MMLREFLLCGAPASAVAPQLQGLDVSVFDASAIHSRIIDASDASSDHRRLRVPIIPASVWTRLTQVVSRERSGSTRWAVVAEDLALFIPVWKHLMPTANIVSPGYDSTSEAGVAETAFRSQYPDGCSLVECAGSSDEQAQYLADAVRGLL